MRPKSTPSPAPAPASGSEPKPKPLPENPSAAKRLEILSRLKAMSAGGGGQDEGEPDTVAE